MIQPVAVTPAPVVKTDILFAGFWRRLLAYLIDGVLLGAVGFIVSLIALFSQSSADWFEQAVNAGRITAAIAWAYFAVLESSPARGTLGKLALNLYVSDVRGDPISFWRASFRYLFKYLSWLVFGIGWLMPAFTPRKQALHDMLAGTLVLRKAQYLVLAPEAPTEPGDYWDGKRWVASVTPPMEEF